MHALMSHALSGRRSLSSLVVAAMSDHLGQGIAGLLLPLIAITVTNSPLLVSGITFSLTLPWLVTGLLAGVVVDRLDRRQVLIGVAIARMAALAILALLLAAGSVTLASLYAVAAIMGITETLLEPALIAAIPAVAEEGRLDQANARIIGGRLVVENVAQGIAGGLVAIGFVLAAGISGLAFLFALRGFLLMRGRFRDHPTDIREGRSSDDESLWQQVVAGIAFVWRTEPLRSITLISAVINGCWAAWWSVWVLYAVAPGPIGLSSFEFGILMSAGSMFSLMGAVTALPIQHRLGRRWAIGLNIVGNAMLFGLSAITTSVLPIVLAILCGDFGAPGWGIASNALQQRIVPDGLRGRVASAYRFTGFGAKAIGAAAGGIIAAGASIPMLYALCALLTLATLVPFFRFITEGAMTQSGEPEDR